MLSSYFNKLVRDRIPEIIEASGETCTTEILSYEDYIKMLDKKLDEELAEYLCCHSIEELADLMEVVRACAVAHGYSVAELEKVRAEKAAKRGGFEKRILLKEVTDNSMVVSAKCSDIANIINANRTALIEHLTPKMMKTYAQIQTMFLKVDVSRDVEFRKKFGGYYRMRFVTQEYRDAFFETFESIKRQNEPSFSDISKKLYLVNEKHEFSFISKMIHTIFPDRPIFDSQVSSVLGIKRKQTLPLELRIKEDEAILNQISSLYKELEQSHLIDEVLIAFDKKFLPAGRSIVIASGKESL